MLFLTSAALFVRKAPAVLAFSLSIFVFVSFIPALALLFFPARRCATTASSRQTKIVYIGLPRLSHWRCRPPPSAIFILGHFIFEFSFSFFARLSFFHSVRGPCHDRFPVTSNLFSHDDTAGMTTLRHGETFSVDFHSPFSIVMSSNDLRRSARINDASYRPRTTRNLPEKNRTKHSELDEDNFKKKETKYFYTASLLYFVS